MLMAIHQASMQRVGMPSGWLTLWRASEPTDHLRKNIIEGDLKAQHAFKTVQAIHFDRKHMAELERLRAPLGASEEEVIAGFKAQESYIDYNAEELYDDKAVSRECEVHPGQECRVRWSDDRDDLDVNRMTTILIGSPLCRPFCPDGGKLGRAHPAEDSRLAYMGEVKYSKSLDLSITENSHLYPKEDFCDELKLASRIPKYIIAAPFDIGWPSGGDRFFGLGANPERFVWIGPPTDDCTDDFLSFFQATVEVDGSIFAGVDNAAGIQAVRQEYGRRKDPPVVVDNGTKTAELLSPAAARFLTGYYELAVEGKKMPRNGVGNMTADISQNPHSRHRAGAWLPRLSRSSQLVRLSDGSEGSDEHIYTSKELSAAHGWPTLDEFPSDLRSLMNFDLSGFSLTQQNDVLGEGIHLPLMLAFVWYAFSHLCRRSDLECMPPPLLPHIVYKAWDHPVPDIIEVSDLCEEDDDDNDAAGGFNFCSVSPTKRRRRSESTDASAGDLFGVTFV